MNKSADQEQATTYSAHLVRLWRSSPASPWRASAQSVISSETVYFDSLAALYGYLHQCTSWDDEQPLTRKMNVINP